MLLNRQLQAWQVSPSPPEAVETSAMTACTKQRIAEAITGQWKELSYDSLIEEVCRPKPITALFIPDE